MNMAVKNPFEDDGVFKVILLEMPDVPVVEEAQVAKKKKNKRGKTLDDHPAPPDPGEERGCLSWAAAVKHSTGNKLIPF